MSYYTDVTIKRSGDDAVTDEQLLAAATKYLNRYKDYFAVEDIVSDLADGLKTGKTSFSDLRSDALTKLFHSLSRKFPKLTIRISTKGEERGDVWSREFHGGKITARRGPAK
jgi:hypothetical protein